MYTGNYSDLRPEIDQIEQDPTALMRNRDVLLNTRIYILADKWDIVGLKSLALRKFKVAQFMQTLSNSFIQSLKLIYTELPESDEALKRTALGFARIYHVDFLRRADFLELCEDCGEIALDMLQAVSCMYDSDSEAEDEYA